MSTLEKMDWNSEYSVDIEIIDNFQKQMFEMFNDLIDLKINKKDSKECVNLISEINDYSKSYFSTEERLLKENGYPDLSTHSKAHRQFTKYFISLRREVAEDAANLTDEVIFELREWLINHIFEFDSLYIPYIRTNNFIKEFK